MKLILSVWLLCFPAMIFSKPHYNQFLIQIENEFYEIKKPELLKKVEEHKGYESFRVFVEHDRETESYKIESLEKEFSGSDAFIARSQKPDPLGSFKAEIYDINSGKAFLYSSVGTGTYYRKLTRAMSFRFPAWQGQVGFRMFAEHPISGEMQLVIDQALNALDFKSFENLNVEVRDLNTVKVEKPIVVAIYAEAYKEHRKEEFFKHAQKVPQTMEKYQVPGRENFLYRAIWFPSEEELGSSRNYSPRLPERNSFLGLYYPYWTDFGRWYHVIYPTRENKFRRALGQTTYDYPIALVDNSGYWGVGNYNSHTALPARTYYFPYLLIHEFGHFMGLNEEYAEPAPNITELSFAPEIFEPWSQNTTFLREGVLKWQDSVSANTPIPTPKSYWDSHQAIGAYKGGYSSPPHLNHKPGFACVMESHKYFCDVCAKAIEKKVSFDRGE